MTKRVCFLLCLATIALRPGITVGHAAEVMKIRADVWMPVNGDPAAANPGYAVEMLRAIFPPQGIEIDYQTMPWPEALKAAEKGEIDGVIGASKIEAAKMVVPSETIAVARVGLFALKGSNWNYANTESFAKIRLGAIEAYDYWEALNDYIQHHAAPQILLLKGKTPLTDGIEKLRHGEIDVLPETIPVFIWALKGQKLSMSDFRIVYTHEGDDVFVAFAPNAAGRRFAKLLDEGLQRLRQSGALTKILRRYGLEDWK